MLCNLCRINPALENGTLCQSCRNKFGTYDVNIVLEGSDEYDFGLVKDCGGLVNVIPEDAQVVGYWSSYNSGTIWVNLMSPIQALQDDVTTKIVGITEERKKSAKSSDPSKPKSTRTKAAKEPSLQQVKPAHEDVLNSLRAMFKKS